MGPNECSQKIFFNFPGGSGEERVEKDSGVTVQFLPREEFTSIRTVRFFFFPTSPQLFFPFSSPDALGTEQAATQELYVRIPRS
jgi:hypothetical protein